MVAARLRGLELQQKYGRDCFHQVADMLRLRGGRARDLLSSLGR